MTQMLSALVRRSISRSWRGIAAVMLMLCAFQVAVVLIASSLERSRAFAQLAAIVPAFIGQAIGGTVQMFASFGGLVGFGFFHPVVILAVVQGGIYIASEPADEVERGLVDLVAARPVPRHLLVTRAVIAAGGAVAITVLAMTAASLLAVRLFAPSGAPALGAPSTALLAAHLAALGWCFAAASLLIASYARRRAAAFGGIGIGAMFLFLVDVAAASWPALAPLRPFTPYHYYQGMLVLIGASNPARDLSILLSSTAVLIAWAYVQYERRDL